MTDLSNSRILIVDDTVFYLDNLVSILSDNYQVSVARSGEEALEEIETIRPDLILLDIMMPGMNGYEVCRRLKSDEETRYIPVIFLTAKSDEQSEAMGFTLGAVDYIIKPFSQDLVKARVKNHLELKYARDELVKQNEILKKNTQLSIAAQHSSVSVILIDTNGKIKYINQTFTDMTGYSEQEVLDQKTSVLQPEKMKIDQYRDMWSTLNTGQNWTGTLLTQKKNGEHFWQKLSISPIVNDQGEIDSFVSIGEDITEQKILLEERDKAIKHIDESIQYASRIQRSILPTEEALHKTIPEHFVLWKPRDVVGGDIYWLRAWGSGSLIIIGDCTGHGVPGAFMTLISNGALNEAYLETPPGNPGTLLQRMHQLIQWSLGQSNDQFNKSDDGIELGACFLDSTTGTLTFAGARFDLFILQNKEVSVIRGTKAGLGYSRTPYDIQFDNHEVELCTNQVFYMTTDGLLDQIGGPKKRGFGKKRFKSLITSMVDVPLSDQSGLIMQALVDYEGNEKRRDDVTVIGFKADGDVKHTKKAKAVEFSTAPVLNCKELDDDHQKLYGILVNLTRSIDSDKDRESSFSILEELVLYTNWHFRHEERLMQIYSFPYQSEHEAEHKSLVDKVSELTGNIQATENDIPKDLMQLLQEWLQNHILVQDKKLADFLINLGISQTKTGKQLTETDHEVEARQDLFVLEDSLLVGYNVIDDDHKKLVDIMNQLQMVLSDNRDKNEIMETLEFLVKYTDWHFRHEERLMQTNNYPDMTIHKREHKLLIDQVQYIQHKFMKNDDKAPHELNAMLKAWLINHIYEVDSKLSAFLKSRY